MGNSNSCTAPAENISFMQEGIIVSCTKGIIDPTNETKEDYFFSNFRSG